MIVFNLNLIVNYISRCMNASGIPVLLFYKSKKDTIQWPKEI